ncbi:MAG: TIGR02281 family clan AA aspartic protease [Pseudomonadota bacterium]
MVGMTDLTSDDIGRLIYLVILVTVIGGYFFASAHQSLGKTAQSLVLWGLIFLGVAAGYGLWQEASHDIISPQVTIDEGDQTIRIARSRDGHFYATALINESPTRFLVDTGASELVLSQRAAEAAGIDVDALPFLGTARTANGSVSTARVRLESFSFGGFVDADVPATVNGGKLDISLLGQRYLSRFDKIEITSDHMLLTR